MDLEDSTSAPTSAKTASSFVPLGCEGEKAMTALHKTMRASHGDDTQGSVNLSVLEPGQLTPKLCLVLSSVQGQSGSGLSSVVSTLPCTSLVDDFLTGTSL